MKRKWLMIPLVTGLLAAGLTGATVLANHDGGEQESPKDAVATLTSRIIDWLFFMWRRRFGGPLVSVANRFLRVTAAPASIAFTTLLNFDLQIGQARRRKPKCAGRITGQLLDKGGWRTPSAPGPEQNLRIRNFKFS